MEKVKELTIETGDLVACSDVDFTDGSRWEGRTSAGTTPDYRYLGKYATVMDADIPAILWDGSYLEKWRQTAKQQQEGSRT